MIHVIGTIGLCAAGIGLVGILYTMASDNMDAPFGLFIALLIGGLIAVLPSVVSADNERRDAFMKSCLQDKKDYECTAMWRAGDSRTFVAPVPVILPGGRR